MPLTRRSLTQFMAAGIGGGLLTAGPGVRAGHDLGDRHPDRNGAGFRGPRMYRGWILYVVDTPPSGADDTEADQQRWLRQYRDGVLVVSTDGHIADVGNYHEVAPRYPDIPCRDYRGMLIMPGFIDSHVHYVQTQIIASYGRTLLEWLNEFAFPVEEQFSAPQAAAAVADIFLRYLFQNGTTTSVTFAATYPVSASALFEAASAYNMRIITGKTWMDRNAPPQLLDTPESAYRDSRELIRRWHGKGRNLYAITPRFAITSTFEQLRLAGILHAEYPSTYIHTHLSETRAELALVRELFPGFRDYLAVYEAAGLVTERSVLAHGVYLSGSELSRVSAARSTIAHCPTSNLFLASGLYDLQRANRRGVQTSIGTDVGGGTSFSLLRTLDETYKSQHLQGYPVNAFEMLYLCTLGAARHLHLAGKIGSLDIGHEADFVVIDYLAQGIQRTRMEYLRSTGGWTTESMLFGLEITGDDRNVAATYVMGRPVYASRLHRGSHVLPPSRASGVLPEGLVDT